jgi:hypothetical protein
MHCSSPDVLSINKYTSLPKKTCIDDNDNTIDQAAIMLRLVLVSKSYKVGDPHEFISNISLRYTYRDKMAYLRNAVTCRIN